MAPNTTEMWAKESAAATEDGHPPTVCYGNCEIAHGVLVRYGTVYVAEAILEVYAERDKLKPMEIVEARGQLRHFTARLREIDG